MTSEKYMRRNESEEMRRGRATMVATIPKRVHDDSVDECQQSLLAM